MANLKGIDISKWQGDITDEDWKKIKKSVDFVIIKAGGSDSANRYEDSKFRQNYERAKKVGLKVGAYYFNGKNFTTHAEGVADAKHFCELLKGKTFEFPVYCDIEAQDYKEKEGITSATIGFCQHMESQGYWVGIYGSDIAGFSDRLNYDKIKCYATWVARYGGNLVHNDCGIRQTSDSGKVDGISGNVDIDEAYIDYEPLIKAKGLNGFGEIQEEIIPSISMPSTIKTYKKTDDIQLTKNFHLREFICKCGQYCSTVMVDLKLFAYLQAIREHFGKPLTPTSGYRCPIHNRNVGGASQSYHTKGRACDFVIEGVKPSEIAAYAESLGCLGIGLYDNFVHIDTRTTKFFWYSSAELPRTTFGGKPAKVETPKVEEPKAEISGTKADSVAVNVKKAIFGDVAKSYDSAIAGAYSITATGLNCRKNAGTSHDSLCVIKQDDYVRCFGCYTEVDGVKWYQIQAYVGGVIYTGFSSSKYLKKL
jgi:GH25 family lysozyme M1 (1,4-beta-N-acetylmuramidase)